MPKHWGEDMHVLVFLDEINLPGKIAKTQD